MILRIYKFSPYQLDLRFAFHLGLKDTINKWPGSYFDSPEEGEIGIKRWIVPIEFYSDVLIAAQRFGFITEVRYAPVDPIYNDSPDLSGSNPAFHLHQRETLAETLANLQSTGAHLINLAMRMGKTGVAIECLRLLNIKSCIIICPAMVRREWEREFKKWWPESPMLHVHEPNPSKKSLSHAAASAFHIVSYGQVSKLSEDIHPELICLDEIHYIQGNKTKQSKAVFTLSAKSPEAKRIGLTGTAVTTHLDSIHAPLDWLWPDRFGSKGAFKFRYLESEDVYDKSSIKRGLKYLGPRKDTAEELKKRLKQVSTRRTKADCPGLFPPLECKLLQPDSVRSEAVSLAQDILASGESVGLLSYEKAEAEYYAKELGCELLTGDEVAAKRDARIERLRQEERNLPVSFSGTISATSTGINLSFCSNFIYTQLSDKIYELIQSFARGHVMAGRSVMIYLMVSEDKMIQAQRIQRKISAINEIITAGIEETQLSNSMNLLKDKGYSDEEWASACSLLLGDKFDDGSEIT